MWTVNSLRLACYGALLAATVAAGCQCYPDPILIIQPPPATEAAARPVSGLFIDASTNKLITSEVIVAVRDRSGALSGATQDSLGAPRSEFTLNNGVLSFQVDAEVALPLDLVVVGRAKGFNSTSVNLTIDQDGAAGFVARMVNISDPPVGVAATTVSAGTADATGTTVAAKNMKTPPEPTTGGTVEVTVPAGTKVTSESGAPLTGALTASISYYNNTDPTSLAAFPGGLEVAVATDGGAASDGVFISGGFAAIEITDSAGRQAATFSQPVAVTVNMPTATVNPVTGAKVQIGETVPFWSYSEITGGWTSEGNVVLAAGPNGLLAATGQVTHLSYFNLDWFETPCGLGRKVVVSGNPQNLDLTLELRNTGRGYHKLRTLAEVWDGTSDFNTVQLINAPRNVQMNVTATYNGTVVGSVNDISDLCAGSDIPLSVALPTVTGAALTAKVFQVCLANSAARTPVPNISVVAQSGAQAPLMPKITNGEGKVTFSGLESGRTYLVEAYASGGTLPPLVSSLQLAAGDANELVFEQPVECAVVTGASSGNR